MWQISMQYPAPGFKLTTFWSPPLITRPEADPLKILQRKIWSYIFFKHFDWLFKSFNQSECLKNLPSIKFTL